MGGILRTFRDAWDMETFIGKNGYVYIARDKEHMEQLKNLHTERGQQELIEVQTVRNAMTPIKTHFTLSGDILDIETA